MKSSLLRPIEEKYDLMAWNFIYVYLNAHKVFAVGWILVEIVSDLLHVLGFVEE